MTLKTKETIHLDGSICMLRKTLPKKSEIAKYWREKIFDLGLFMDWGEPSCWRCGFYLSDNDIINPNTPFEDIFLCWDKQNYLERAHVIPKSQGGCSCHGNIVLLCKKCHDSNPDTKDIESFKIWFTNKKSFLVRGHEEMTSAFAEFNLKLTLFDMVLMTTKEFIEYSIDNSVSVRGKINDASRIASLIEWKKKYSTIELLSMIPEYYKEEVTKEINNGY